jgi:sortase A
MAAPRGAGDAGWYKFGFKPGEKGNAVIAGHLDTDKNTDGVFRNLNQLKAGDDIFVTGDSGNQSHFIVSTTETYEGATAPLSEIFGASDKPRLNLITCAGVWDSKKHMYTHRLVVSAEMD